MVPILAEFIQHFVSVFIDDIAVKYPSTNYDESSDENGLRKFIREHIDQLNTVLKRLEMSGIISADKLEIGRDSAVFVGYLCTKEGRLPDPSKVRRVEDWPYFRRFKRHGGWNFSTGRGRNMWSTLRNMKMG
ncbi:hypothetical protein V1527DRAFT_93787 [Lipomyces starkeyi]